MERQEAEHRRVFEEMVRDDRVQKVEELKKKFATRRMMGEELMQSLDVTISREGSTEYQAMSHEHQEDIDWKVVEVSEHALLDQWKMELDIEVLDDGDWKMLFLYFYILFPVT